MGVASSSATLFRTLGGSFGVAIMGALFTNRVPTRWPSGAGGGRPGHREDVAAGRGRPGEAAGRRAGRVPARGGGRYALGLPAGRRDRVVALLPRSSSRRCRCGAGGEAAGTAAARGCGPEEDGRRRRPRTRRRDGRPSDATGTRARGPGRGSGPSDRLPRRPRPRRSVPGAAVVRGGGPEVVLRQAAGKLPVFVGACSGSHSTATAPSAGRPAAPPPAYVAEGEPRAEHPCLARRDRQPEAVPVARPVGAAGTEPARPLAQQRLGEAGAVVADPDHPALDA